MNGNLLFVGGDLSGIQKFLYNITSKRAMVSLKGRSAYLKQFTDKVCERILNIHEIKASSFSQEEMKIYCSGGKFYLQVPDTENIRNHIYKLRNDIESEIWEKHKGQLSINIDFVPFCYEGDRVKVGDEIDNIGILWSHITEKFQILKNQKFKNQLLENYDDFFEINKVGGNVRVCEISGIEGAKEKKFKFKDEEESIFVLDSVADQIEIGISLRNRQHFKMLEEYADKSYLGILRMDVDNLGSKFIKSDFANMSDYRDFSRKLDRFFDSENGKLNEIFNQECEDEFVYRNHLNIVYAGGDDIFVVGRWDKTIDFASEVVKEFKQYRKDVLNDNNLSISGGVAIVNKKFPISKAAEMAGDAEHSAKIYNDGQKNAFCMFGECISWNDEEFGYVENYKNKFIELIANNNLSRGILHKIMTYAAIVKKNKEIEEENSKGDFKRKPNSSYLWHTAYYLSRYMERYKKTNPLVYDFCKELRDKELHSPEKFRLMSLAARWAEMILRLNDKMISNNN